jgi:hypothetical protein
VIATMLSLVGCSTERDRQWYKPNTNYTVDDFKRDRDDCTTGNTLDEPAHNTIRGKYY